MEERNDKEPGIHIDESIHQEVPSLSGRAVNAAVAVFLGFLLYHIIWFWIFPGLGVYGLRPLTSYGFLTIVDSLLSVGGITWLAICAVFGWFNGRYFIDRLQGYIDFWKFW